jgi:hypothetical protein
MEPTRLTVHAIMSPGPRGSFGALAALPGRYIPPAFDERQRLPLDEFRCRSHADREFPQTIDASVFGTSLIVSQAER